MEGLERATGLGGNSNKRRIICPYKELFNQPCLVGVDRFHCKISARFKEKEKLNQVQ